MNYSLTSSKSCSVFFQASYKEFTQLDSTMLLFVYNHNGYLLKLPLSLCDEGDNGPGLAMSGLITLGINALVYVGYHLIKKRKAKTKSRDQKTGFARYLSNLERANSYLVES